MTTLVPLVLGLIIGLTFVRYAGKRRRPYAVGLLVVGLIYVAFAAVGGASIRWLALEGLGLLLFGAAAWSGLRGWPAMLAVGWAVHVAWDVLLHLDGAGAVYTPDWYPWICVSFDLVLAGALLPLARSRGVIRSRPLTSTRSSAPPAKR